MHPSIPESMYTQFLSARLTPFKNGTLNNEVTHVHFHKPCTSKTPLTVFKKNVYAKRDKHM